LIDSPKPAPRTDTARIPSTYTGPTDQLIIPVAGIKATQLVDTYTQARSGGRAHDAIDIIAPHNTPVLAATSGTILRLFQSKLGGTTLYQLGPDQHTVYYYAHLDHYADGLAQGSAVKQGEIIGYVGDTGDAGAGNYHLHFAIWKIEDPKKFWDGQNINPYPILRQAH
jgi:murein DD-endopeptidase MepM/ murein hydrolase activator NlpD